MIVLKFGGTSVADRAAHERLVDIVSQRLAHSPLVVVSAMSGVSDALIVVLERALAGDDEASAGALRAIGERHRLVLGQTPAPKGEVQAASSVIEEIMGGLESLRRGIVLLKDASPWVRAKVVGAGELLSSRIVLAALRAAGMQAEEVDARGIIRTAGLDPEKDPPVPAAIAELADNRLRPHLGPGRVVVTQGFIASDGQGRPTLLGRGGSDYSASLLGSVLGAERIEIWTDVDGVLTANPRIVPDAKRVQLLSFDEASELAYFGAKVLHPSTVLPAIEAEIPVWVGNARRPGGRGTTILAAPVQPVDDRWVVKAIADKRGLSVITIVSTRMLMAHGFLARIFRVFDAHRTSVDLVSTSEVSVSLTVDDERALAAIVEDLSEFARVEVERDMAVICLVGDGMRGRAGLAEEVFRAIRGVPVRMITQGASAINLSLVVSEADREAALRALHGAFFRGSLPPEVFGESTRDLDDAELATVREAAAPRAPLRMQGAALADLARRHGTPAYFYDLDAVEARVATLREGLPRKGTRLFYACKANSNVRILERLARLGVGIEAASPAEVDRALECGHAPDSVVLSASNAHPESLGAVAARGCHVTLGARSDVRRLGPLAPGARVLLRLNPGVGDGHHRHVVTGGSHSKFGIALAELDEALGDAAAAGLEVIGLHVHIGSGITDGRLLLTAAERVLAAAERLPGIRVIDLGGGFGVPYRDRETEFDVPAFGSRLEERLQDFHRTTGRRPELWFEPGRYLVAAAGVLVAEVTCRKESDGLVFIGLDTGMNHLIRPALYGAYHRIVNLSAPDGPLEWVEVVGNVCETTDVFASRRPIPRAEEGHLLGFLDAGAYGFSMASRYNLWPLPTEVVLSGGIEV
jgi:diaminopimelate decarboxylase/aspartate kinase